MKVPYLRGDYIPVYQPQADVFLGPDSEHFHAEKCYEQWVPNDFTIVHDGKHWHLIGITHPKPEWFLSPDSPINGRNIHEAEWQLFHAVSTGNTLKESLYPNGFQQVEQVLPATFRPNERPEIWAPICWKHDGRYVLLYSPDPMRTAVSDDFIHWQTEGPAFFCGEDSARDPNIMEKDGIYSVVYLVGNTLYLRESRDLRHYSEPRILFNGPEGVSLESPILKYIDGWYYLIYCIFDGNDQINGAYDYRTYVHASRTLEELDNSPRLAELHAHAPELFQDEQGDWYLASVEWPYRGVSIAPIGWKELEDTQ